ncbi:ATP-binding protein [Streptomyces inhibens]|uniref:ATP-binding protein n=1 Tax=Streptomyces inhibens TaxID=2293571 RepID=UPI00247A5836|nr:ATP-binding protein [Streptomyces inhibens]UKY54170.1 ATP-binding protein [Streptomyces inhibens]
MLVLADPPPATVSPSAPPLDSLRSTPHQTLIALPSEDARVSSARRFTADMLRRWGIAEDTRDSAVLIVSELVSNAARHGHADTTLFLTLNDCMLQIAVADSGAPVAHQHAHADSDPDEHGRGTGIVEFLAQWIEIHHSESGRQVHVGLRVADPQPC